MLAGAGFVGLYNTYYRADRMTLHLFAAPGGEEAPLRIAPIARPSEAPHHYLHDAEGRVVAADRKGKHYVWNPIRDSWKESPQPPALELAGARFTTAANRITGEEGDVFTFDPARGATSSYYIAAGRLFFQLADASSPNAKPIFMPAPGRPARSPRSMWTGRRCSILRFLASFPIPTAS